MYMEPYIYILRFFIYYSASLTMDFLEKRGFQANQNSLTCISLGEMVKLEFPTASEWTSTRISFYSDSNLNSKRYCDPEPPLQDHLASENPNCTSWDYICMGSHYGISSWPNRLTSHVNRQQECFRITLLVYQSVQAIVQLSS